MPCWRAGSWAVEGAWQIGSWREIDFIARGRMIIRHLLGHRHPRRRYPKGGFGL